MLLIRCIKVSPACMFMYLLLIFLHGYILAWCYRSRCFTACFLYDLTLYNKNSSSEIYLVDTVKMQMAALDITWLKDTWEMAPWITSQKLSLKAFRTWTHMTHNIGKCFLLLRQCTPTLLHVNHAGDSVSNTTTQEVKFYSFQSVNVMLNVGRFNRSVKP